MEFSKNQEDELLKALETAFACSGGEVAEFEHIPKGADTLIYRFVFRYHPHSTTDAEQQGKILDADLIQSKRLVARIFARQDAEHARRNVTMEFTIQKSLFEQGIAVPKAICLVLSQYGPPYYIMEEIVGISLADQLEKNMENQETGFEANQGLIQQFISKIVDLHQLSLDALNIPGRSEILDETGFNAQSLLQQVFANVNRVIEHYDVTELRPIFDWLQNEAQSITYTPLVWTHGDYHPENVMLRENGELVILDWTNMQIADFRVDLGFAIVVFNAFIPGFDFTEPLRELYQSISDNQVTDLAFFKVLSHFHNLMRLYSMVNDYRITGENDGTKQVLLHTYRPYAQALLHTVKSVTGHNVSSVEQYLIDNPM